MNSTTKVEAIKFTVAFCCALLTFRACAAEGVIDDFHYTDDAVARAAWRPMQGSPNATVATIEGHRALRLACDFLDGKNPRGSWDHAVKLDLTASRGVEFEILCSNTLPISYFSIYLQSGGGWYSAVFYPETTGWNTITIDKSEFKAEGKPAGFDRIKTVRFSAWRDQNVNTEFALSDLHKAGPTPVPGSRESAESLIAKIGVVASYKTYDEATNEIARLNPKDAHVMEALKSAAALHDAAVTLAGSQQFGAAESKARSARNEMRRAFCLAQHPEPGEFRAFWCHSAFGVQGMTWDEAIRRLSENGFNAIIPNMLAGGAAFYDSKVLPVAASVAKRGDQIRECVAACRKYGVQIHVWKLDWNLGSSAPKEFVDKLRAEKRLQRGVDGKEELWLCPSQPENQHLEIAAMTELVRNYDIDGIHFDYIRYPGINFCFCDGCKERFQHANGITLKNWPADVLAGGPYREQWLDWRRSNITTVVKAVSEQARAIKPNIKLSAAVFRYWSTDRDDVGQDWKVWCDKGYLDFVCPMDYTPSNRRFENMVTQQAAWAGKVPVYPGLGASASSSHFQADRAVEEINISRQLHTHGFVIFSYGPKETTDELLPMLGMGITAKQP